MSEETKVVETHGQDEEEAPTTTTTTTSQESVTQFPKRKRRNSTEKCIFGSITVIGEKIIIVIINKIPIAHVFH